MVEHFLVLKLVKDIQGVYPRVGIFEEKHIGTSFGKALVWRVSGFNYLPYYR